MVLKPWGERTRPVFEIVPEVQMEFNKVPGIRTFAITPPALPGGGDYPVEFVISSVDEPQRILEFATQIQLKAAASGMFAFPPTLDTKIDQPEVELVLDRDKVASMGLDMRSVGADLSALVGGNFVNRFNFAGRSYKVIPQLKRIERLDPAQLQEHLRERPDEPTVPLGTFATIEEQNRAAFAQSFPATQRGEDFRRRHRSAR